jgi:hypothetical protein
MIRSEGSKEKQEASQSAYFALEEGSDYNNGGWRQDNTRGGNLEYNKW